MAQRSGVGAQISVGQATASSALHAGEGHYRGSSDQVKPMFRMKCPSLRLRTPPPAQCTMNASRMMAKTATTTQKKNTTMPGIAYPATVLALLATGRHLPVGEGIIH
jgi:hypothetical protein